ncbi:MAG: hypothetical protein ISR55_02085 [Bacteroidetes bacterium]|nr:hypothetical protein [Bacteroidota bacterium]
MHRRDLKVASGFSLFYGIFSMIYSFGLIGESLSDTAITLYLILITVLVSIILLYFKRFLKYYYNFKDKTHVIIWIISLEIVHAIFIIIFSENLKRTNDFYFIYSSMAILLSTVLLLFYAIFASKLMTLSRKRTKLILPFALSFYLIPVISILSFSYSIFLDGDVMHAIEYNNSALILTFLKIFPFLLLPVLYYRAYFQKKRSHSNRQHRS